jgi:hypothetical protein
VGDTECRAADGRVPDRAKWSDYNQVAEKVKTEKLKN